MINPTEPEYEPMITVGAYTTPWEAQLARACLEAEGIDSALADEHLGRIIGGVKLRVREADAPRAVELLRSRRPLPDIHLVTEADLPLSERRCPTCKSDNLAHEVGSVLGFLGSWLLSLPEPPRRWSCHGCGSVWEDEEEDPMADLVTVARFTTPWEAHLARTLLESEGIDACVTEERLPPVNLLTGEVPALNRLEVHEENAERALDLLSQVTQEPARASAGATRATE